MLNQLNKKKIKKEIFVNYIKNYTYISLTLHLYL